MEDSKEMSDSVSYLNDDNRTDDDVFEPHIDAPVHEITNCKYGCPGVWLEPTPMAEHYKTCIFRLWHVENRRLRAEAEAKRRQQERDAVTPIVNDNAERERRAKQIAFDYENGSKEFREKQDRAWAEQSRIMNETATATATPEAEGVNEYLTKKVHDEIDAKEKLKQEQRGDNKENENE